MGILVDVAEPGSEPPGSSEEPSGFGNRLRTVVMCAAAILVLAIGSYLVLIEPSDNGAATLDRSTTTSPDPRTNSFSEDSEPAPRPDQLVQALTDELLLVIASDFDRDTSTYGPLVLRAIEISTGRSATMPTPEPLLHREPLAIGGSEPSGKAGVVVIGINGAWFGEWSRSQFTWNYLGSADAVKPATQTGRLWLQTDANASFAPDTRPPDARFLWTEVTMTGEIVRTLYRNNELALPSPELTVASGSGIFRLATEAELAQLGLPDTETHWRPLSVRGTVLAIGPNDLVVSECATFLECDRVWYDPVTGAARGGLFDDLAEGLNPRFAALMSPDGRFTAAEGENSETKIISVATHREIPNRCIWGTSLAWSNHSELLACGTAAGIEMYELADGASLGLASESGGRWAVFMRPSP